MQIDVSLAIGASVLMHVCWNLMARQLPQKSTPLWWVLLTHLLLFAPYGIYTLVNEVHWSIEFSGVLLVSALANAIYFYALYRAYQYASVAFVYPLVRSSPILIALWAFLFFDNSLAMSSWLGIGLNVLGLMLMARSGKSGNEKYAMPWAMIAMLATSIYSLSDKAATAHVSSITGLLGYISLGYFFSWCAISIQLFKETGSWIPAERIKPMPMLIGGICIGWAYALIIFAMKHLHAAEVVAYSNAGIILATLFSIFMFQEKWQWKSRLVSVGMITAGLLMIALGKP